MGKTVRDTEVLHKQLVCLCVGFRLVIAPCEQINLRSKWWEYIVPEPFAAVNWLGHTVHNNTVYGLVVVVVSRTGLETFGCANTVIDDLMTSNTIWISVCVPPKVREYAGGLFEYNSEASFTVDQTIWHFPVYYSRLCWVAPTVSSVARFWKEANWCWCVHKWISFHTVLLKMYLQ